MLYLRWITNKDFLYSTGNTVQYSVITRIWITASRCCEPETSSIVNRLCSSINWRILKRQPPPSSSCSVTLLSLLLSRFSRVRLCNPIDGSPPGSPVPGILQARTLEWVAVSLPPIYSFPYSLITYHLVFITSELAMIFALTVPELQCVFTQT